MVYLTAAFGTLLLCAACLGDETLVSPQPPSAKAQAILARAFTAIRTGFEQANFDYRPNKDLLEASAKFDRALDVLADCVDEATARRLTAAEATSMNAKLLAIARDRRRHPKRYQELWQTYDLMAPGVDNLHLRLPRSPPLAEKHATEEYRLAWEYRLLDPKTAERGLDRPPTLEALARLRKDASVLTLVYYFRCFCQDDDERKWNGHRYTMASDALKEFRTSRALAGLLECVAWQKQQYARLGPSPERKYLPEEMIHKLASRSRLIPDKELQEWRVVIVTFPQEGLPAEQRRWLDEALKRR